MIFDESSLWPLDLRYRDQRGETTHHCHFRLDALGRNVHLERVNLRVLREPKVDNLIEQLVDQDKVVLDRLLVELAKIRSTDLDESVQKLKDQCCRRVAPGVSAQVWMTSSLGHGDEVDVVDPDMEKRGRAEGDDG